MKYIITEDQKKFLRRIGSVEQNIDSFMDHTYTFLQGTDKVTRLYDKNVESFIDLVGMGLSSMIMRDSNLEGDERIIVRNRLQRYITTEYRDRIKDYYLQRNKSYDNLNESSTFLRRRFTNEDLKLIVDYVKDMIDGGVSVESATYDGIIRDFIKNKRFSDIDEFGTEQSYWDSYLKYEKALDNYVKTKLGLDWDPSLKEGFFILHFARVLLYTLQNTTPLFI